MIKAAPFKFKSAMSHVYDAIDGIQLAIFPGLPCGRGTLGGWCCQIGGANNVGCKGGMSIMFTVGMRYLAHHPSGSSLRVGHYWWLVQPGLWRQMGKVCQQRLLWMWYLTHHFSGSSLQVGRYWFWAALGLRADHLQHAVASHRCR